MKFHAFIASVAAAALATAQPKQAQSPLDVTLDMVGNSKVRATVTNTGQSSLKILKTGGLLDITPTRKVHVKSKDKDVPFRGLEVLLAREGHSEDAFEILDEGGALTRTFDIAETHDLSQGGDFSLQAAGRLSVAKEGSTRLHTMIPYKSNKITVDVDGDKADAIHRKFYQKDKRALEQDCGGDQEAMVTLAQQNCQKIANAAADAAQSVEDATMDEYFKGSDPDTRNIVTGVMNNVSAECQPGGGVSKLYCNDIAGACGSGLLAYTANGEFQVYCDGYWGLPDLTSDCHAQDKASVALHETTHLGAIHGTADIAYFFDGIQGLTRDENLNNADTYALFANGIYAGC